MKVLDYIKERYERLSDRLIDYVNSDLFDVDVQHILEYDSTLDDDLAKECAIDQEAERITARLFQ